MKKTLSRPADFRRGGFSFVLLDNTGMVVVEYKYDAWGKCLTSVLDPNASAVAKLNPFRIKMISPETVYYSDGRINNTPEDEGTINIFDPAGKEKNLPWYINNGLHFYFDVLPYYFWGNSPDDSTTIIKRIGTGWLY